MKLGEFVNEKWKQIKTRAGNTKYLNRKTRFNNNKKKYK